MVPSVATRNVPVSSGSPYTRTSNVSSMPMRSAGSPSLASARRLRRGVLLHTASAASSDDDRNSVC